MLSEKPWQLEAVLRLGLGIFCCISLGSLLGHGLLALVGNLPESGVKVLSLFVGTLSFQGAAVVLIGLFLREHGVSWAAAFGFNHPNVGRALALAVLVALVVLPIAWTLAEFSSRLMTQVKLEPLDQPAVQTLKNTQSRAVEIFFGSVALVLAPVVEEFLFRGILYPTLKQRVRRSVALWGTSLIFAGIHLNAVTFVPLTFLAVVLTLLYERTDNLLAPIVTHCLFNAANFFWLMSHRPPPAG